MHVFMCKINKIKRERERVEHESKQTEKLINFTSIIRMPCSLEFANDSLITRRSHKINVMSYFQKVFTLCPTNCTTRNSEN